MLQCAAVCVAVCVSVLQCVAVIRPGKKLNVFRCAVAVCVAVCGAVCCSVLQCAAVCVAVCSSVLQSYDLERSSMYAGVQLQCVLQGVAV